jgi:hypothetical protein
MNRTDQSRKFKNWNALQLALKRAGVSSHGSIATLLLETFLEDNGRLQASKVVARGICEEGSFSNWRNDMIRIGWLVWSSNQADKGQYFAGKKLISYLNKEKFFSKEILTRDEAASKSEVEDLKERMNRIEDVVQDLKKAMEPPETDEKRKARERAAERLTLLAKTH